MESIENAIDGLDMNCQDNTLVSLYEAQVRDLDILLNIQLKVICLQAQMMEMEKQEVNTTDIELAAVLYELDEYLGFSEQQLSDLEDEYNRIFNQIDMRNQEIHEYLKQPELLN